MHEVHQNRKETHSKYNLPTACRQSLNKKNTKFPHSDKLTEWQHRVCSTADQTLAFECWKTEVVAFLRLTHQDYTLTVFLDKVWVNQANKWIRFFRAFVFLYMVMRTLPSIFVVMPVTLMRSFKWPKQPGNKIEKQENDHLGDWGPEKDCR